jgi:hypothetical protein
MLLGGRARLSANPAETGGALTLKTTGNGQAESTNLESGCALRHDEINGQSHQLRGQVGHALDHVVAVAELDHQVAALDIAKISKCGAHRAYVRRQARRLLCGEPTDADDLRRALRRNGSRHDGHGEEGKQKRAPSHSITSSARASSDGGTSRPRTLAVLRLMTNSNVVGNWTGRSAGFAPFKI